MSRDCRFRYAVLALFALRNPTTLFRWPTLFAGVLTAAAVLGIVSAAPALFLSSAASARLEDELSSLSRSSAGLSTSLKLTFPTVRRLTEGLNTGGPPIRARRLIDLQQARIQELAARTDGLGTPIVSVIGPQVAASGPRRIDAVDLRIVTRSRFSSHVVVIEQLSGNGLWIPDGAAKTLGVRPGDYLHIESGEGQARVRVRATYRALGAVVPLPSFWDPLRNLILPPTDKPGPGSGLPSLGFADPTTVQRLAEAMRWRTDVRWELPLAGRDFTLGAAETLSRQILATSDAIPRFTYEGRYALFGAAEFFKVLDHRYTTRHTPTTATALPAVVRAATETRNRIAVPAGAVATISLLASVGLLAAAGYYTVQRRAVEYRLLAVRGVGRISTVFGAVVEALLPVAMGGGIAVALAYTAIETWVPGRIDPRAVAEATGRVAAGLAGGLAAYAVSVAAAAERLVPLPARRFSYKPAYTDVALFVVAVMAYAAMARHSAGVDGSRAPDLSLVLAPLIALGATAGLLLRRGPPTLEMIKGAWRPRSPQVYLALRRLARQSVPALVLGSSAAVGAGLLVYTSTLVSSGKATTYAKSHVFVGSDVEVYVYDPFYAERLSVPATTVVKLDDAQAAGRDVDVLGIDLSTFDDAAYWDPSFSGTSLHDLMARLGKAPDASLPAVLAGSTERPSSLDVQQARIPVQIVGRADSFPGMRIGRPLIVVDKARLLSALDARQAHGSTNPYLWAKGPTDRVLREMAQEGLAAEFALTAREAASSPTQLALTWTLSTLRVLGYAIGALAVGGLLLYLAAQQRARALSFALMRRMGLSRRAHRAAIAIELACTLMAAVSIGIGSGAICAVLLRHVVDLLPQVPPDVLIRFPYLDAILAVASVIVSTALGTVWVQRAAERTKVAEVLRSSE